MYHSHKSHFIEKSRDEMMGKKKLKWFELILHEVKFALYT